MEWINIEQAQLKHQEEYHVKIKDRCDNSIFPATLEFFNGDWIWPCLESDDYEVVKVLDESTPPASRQEEWISVEDEMPEDLEDVLTVHTDAGGIVMAYYSFDEQRWYEHHADMEETLLVTHWRPLPAPPQAKQVS